MNGLLEKGCYKTINQDFLGEGHKVLEEVAKIQEKWGKGDTDTFINELRDSMAGYYLGYDLVNTEKHGFDCKKSTNQDTYLEVKSASFAASTWNATFNDTNMEKATFFKSDNVYLCLAIWKNASNLLFMVYGKNPKIGELLENKVKRFLSGKCGKRSTQTLGISPLVFKYGLDVICVNETKAEVKKILTKKNSRFSRLPDNQLLDLAEYREKYGLD